jgi:N12 class adenine-specific DNA methylase
MAEMWTMQRYLQPDTLSAFRLQQFDTWAGNFGESVTALELAPDGRGYRMHTRFARFVNLPELMSMFGQVADIRTAEMLKLPVPRALKETAHGEADPWN